MKRDRIDSRPWYHDGLRFQCTGCGACCTGDPGYVWVNKAEIAAMAAAMEIEVSQFERRFVRKVGVRKSLVELTGGDCAFYDRISRRCTIYAVRPRQCRSWPFWDSNLGTPEDWDDVCRICPGAGRGPLIPVDQVEHRKGQIRI